MKDFVIDEVTDADRRAEYEHDPTPKMVTKAGKLTAYAMGCGYIYQVVADFRPDRDINTEDPVFTRVTMGPLGDCLEVRYFSNASGEPARRWWTYEGKREAEVAYENVARQVRQNGVMSDG